MSEPIKVGDLVYIVRSHHCAPSRGSGYVFTVEAIELAYSHGCAKCGKALSEYYGEPLLYGTLNGKKGYHLARWCKRIPPLGELEGEKRKEEIAA